MTRPLHPSLASIASCISGYDPAALPAAQARASIDQLVPRVRAAEMLPMRSRSEEHTSALQSLLRTSYADFCLKKTSKQLKYTTCQAPSPPTKSIPHFFHHIL